MGGLIVRSYLSGKQTAEGTFNPPAETKIRKLVFLATPHFGTAAAGTSRPSSSLPAASLFTIWRRGIRGSRICGASKLYRSSEMPEAEL
jgi:hypothetical protein